MAPHTINVTAADKEA